MEAANPRTHLDRYLAQLTADWAMTALITVTVITWFANPYFILLWFTTFVLAISTVVLFWQGEAGFVLSAVAFYPLCLDSFQLAASGSFYGWLGNPVFWVVFLLILFRQSFQVVLVAGN